MIQAISTTRWTTTLLHSHVTNHRPPQDVHPPYLLRTLLRSIVTHITPSTSLLRSNNTDNEVYLIGTAHISNASKQEVVDLIRLVQPEVVFVELDAGRAAQLRNRRHSSVGNGETDSFELSNLWRGLMSRPPKNKTSDQPNMQSPQPLDIMNMIWLGPDLFQRIGWLPPTGGEMKAALEEADRRCTPVVYGDVEFNETLRGLKSALHGIMSSPAEMMKLMGSVPPLPKELATAFNASLRRGTLLSEDSGPEEFVEAIRTREHARLMTNYLRRCVPSVYHVMVSKRDAHMAFMLRKHCPKGKVVAVVGMAHVDGIEREWEKLDAASS